MPHAKAFLSSLPTELIVVSRAIGRGQLLRLLHLLVRLPEANLHFRLCCEAIMCLAPEATPNLSYLLSRRGR